MVAVLNQGDVSMVKWRQFRLVAGYSTTSLLALAVALPAHAEEDTGKQEIVVTAKRDEAEVNLKVDKAASSDRTGKGLRTLPQSTTVVTSALLKEQ